MEKIAIISDVHGNITALNAVLRDIKSKGINRIFFLGDMIVKCSSPKECVDTIFENCEIILKGNCEKRCLEEPKTEEHYWNRDKLTKEQIQKIISLPLSYDFYMSGLKFRIMHSSPRDIHEKSTFWNYDEKFIDRMRLMFKNTNYLGNTNKKEPDIVVFGHLHRNMILRIDNKTLINTGAVSNTSEMIEIDGKKYTYGSYLVIQGEYNSKEVSLLEYSINKFTYDFELEAEKIKNTDMPYKENAYLEIKTGKYFNRANIK